MSTRRIILWNVTLFASLAAASLCQTWIVLPVLLPSQGSDKCSSSLSRIHFDCTFGKWGWMTLSALWEPHFQTKLLTPAGKWVTMITNSKHQRKTLEASQIWKHKSSFISKNQACVFSFGSHNKVQCGQVGIRKRAHRIKNLSNWSADAEGEKHEFLSRESFAESSQAWYPAPSLPTLTTSWIWSFLCLAGARGSGRLTWAAGVTAAQHCHNIAQQSPNSGNP